MSVSSVRKSYGKRKHLTLKEKVEVIKTSESDPRMKTRALAHLFECGKTQIADVLKKKELTLALYESNVKTRRTSEYCDINEALFQWFNLACSRNIHPRGSQLVEKAKEIAKALGKQDFRGTNGWFDKWKKRYNFKKFAASDESDDVSVDAVAFWKERLPEILQGYKKEDIWNLDETGCFYKALPKRCNKSKKWITVTLITNAAGGREKPIVIWKYENPRCFKHFDKSLLPVDYFNHKNAWMTSDVMERVLTKLNHRFISTGRKVLLLMDNAGCHPDELKNQFSNIEIVFLPAKLQPLDLGIIRNFKVYYCQFLLRHVLAKVDERDSATDVAKTVDMLTAVRWVALAWDKVKPDTISKCFRKAGILNSAMDVITCTGVQEETADPFLIADESMELQNLIDQTMAVEESCPVDEYLRGDDELPTCVDLDGTDWEANFFAELGESTSAMDEVAEDQAEEPVLKLKTFSEAVRSLEDVKLFLESQGCVQEATAVSSTIDNCHLLATTKQITPTQPHPSILNCTQVANEVTPDISVKVMMI